MPYIIRRPGWQAPERLVTPENVFLNRRAFLRDLGLAGGGMLMGNAIAARGAMPLKTYPFPRNKDFELSPAKITPERFPASYNNFYEFSADKSAVQRLTSKFVTDPWPIEIGGLCEKPMKIDAQELVTMMPMEERVYRFRCVEAWAMTVPWSGFPLSKLIEKVQPRPEAKFIRFETFMRPDQAPGFAQMKRYPWPYVEGLRMDEAMNPLVMMVTGIYGKPLPKQHGAPIRVVVPWKYGYKSCKSIVKIDFVDKQPSTFWESFAPDEYPFESNVNPNVPHPRWSQEFERILGNDADLRIKTKLYNGYGDYVAKLYPRA